MSILFYLIYSILFFLVFTPFILKGRYMHLSMLPLLFFPHFNVTCFLKMGLTISFFEIYLLVFFAFTLLARNSYMIRIDTAAKIFGLFLSLSLLSILVAQIRIGVGNLQPSLDYLENPAVRSFMSLNKMFVFIPILLAIKRFYIERKVNIPYYFKKYLAYSGVFPSIAVVLQYFNSSFMLLFNNPSFSETRGWDVVSRPCGLSNEASFYAILCFFSFMGVYYAIEEKIISQKVGTGLYILYFVALVLSISRTGLLVFLSFFLLKYYRRLTFCKIMVCVCTVILASQITIMNFNIIDRFISSFDITADASTAERYGSAEAIWRLALDKGLLWGVGIYNYYYYLMPYLPDYMTEVVTYSKNTPIPSFNLIFQLLAEWGGIQFLFFGVYALVNLRKKVCGAFVRDWFLYMFIFALTVQVLNFSLPFLILLYRKNENSLCDRLF